MDRSAASKALRSHGDLQGMERQDIAVRMDRNSLILPDTVSSLSFQGLKEASTSARVPIGSAIVRFSDSSQLPEPVLLLQGRAGRAGIQVLISGGGILRLCGISQDLHL